MKQNCAYWATMTADTTLSRLGCRCMPAVQAAGKNVVYTQRPAKKMTFSAAKVASRCSKRFAP